VASVLAIAAAIAASILWEIPIVPYTSAPLKRPGRLSGL
jgi:hypothetical protein